MSTETGTNSHHRLCVQRVEIQLAEELDFQDITDIEAAWGMSEADVVAMWLENGTATCTCEDAIADERRRAGF